MNPTALDIVGRMPTMQERMSDNTIRTYFGVRGGDDGLLGVCNPELQSDSHLRRDNVKKHRNIKIFLDNKNRYCNFG